MKYFGKFSFFLKIIFCASLAVAENPPASNPTPFTSFLTYSPHAAEFPAALRSVSTPIEQKQFQAALSAADLVQPKLNRSYEDQLWFLRGVAQQGLGDDKEALKSFDKALKIRPNNMLALYQHAALLKKTNQCPKAIPELREVAWQVRTLAYEMRYLVGECLMTLNQPLDALKEYDAAYKQNPTFLPVLHKMIESRQDLIAKAATPQERATLEAQLAGDLANLTSQEPQDRASSLTLTKLLLNVTDPLLESGKLARGEAIAKKAAEDSQYKDSEFVHLLAQAQIKRGALDEAEQTLNLGLKAAPGAKELADVKDQINIERTLRAQATPTPTPK